MKDAVWLRQRRAVSGCLSPSTLPKPLLQILPGGQALTQPVEFQASRFRVREAKVPIGGAQAGGDGEQADCGAYGNIQAFNCLLYTSPSPRD